MDKVDKAFAEGTEAILGILGAVSMADDLVAVLFCGNSTPNGVVGLLSETKPVMSAHGRDREDERTEYGRTDNEWAGKMTGLPRTQPDTQAAPLCLLPIDCVCLCAVHSLVLFLRPGGSSTSGDWSGGFLRGGKYRSWRSQTCLQTERRATRSDGEQKKRQ